MRIACSVLIISTRLAWSIWAEHSIVDGDDPGPWLRGAQNAIVGERHRRIEGEHGSISNGHGASIDYSGGDHSNASHSNDHGGGHGGIHVASWKYSYVHEPLLITIFVVLIAIIKILFHHAHRLAAVVPESCVLIVVGIIIGFLFLYQDAKSELAFLAFQNDTFFLYLLPPIILEAAYSLKDRAFVDCLGTILLYAVLGTILNVLIVGPILYGFYLAGTMGAANFTFLECLIFSAIVAAVDPVAVLAIFQEVGVNKVLYFMVFGESLFNDAVTIVIYQMILAFMTIDHISAGEFGLGIASFLCVSLGAMLIGFVCGFITAFITKYTSKIRVVEPIIVFGLAYLSYVVAELFHFSGIISIICCGLIQAHYATHNISSKSFISVSYFSKVGSGITESLIFIILGVMLVNDYHAWLDFNIGFTAISLILIITARFTVVFSLAFFVNKHLSGIRKINKQEQFIMAYGGLRGAITFSLVFMLDPGTLFEKDSAKNVLYTSAYVIIFFTTFLQGITIKPLVKLMRIRLQSNDSSLFKEINHAVLENGAAAIEEIIGHKGSYWFKLMAKHFSRRFLRPLLHKHPHQKYNSVLATYQEVSMQSKYADTQVSMDVAASNQIILWNELENDQISHGGAMHAVNSNELDMMDEHKENIRKQQKLKERRGPVPTLPKNMRFDRPSDLLQLHDLLKAAPYKTVHYVMDKNLTGEQSERVKAQISNLSNVRRRNSGVQGGGISNQLLSTALLPMGMGMMMRQPAKTDTTEMSTRRGASMKATSVSARPGSAKGRHGSIKRTIAVNIDGNNAPVTTIEEMPSDEENESWRKPEKKERNGAKKQDREKEETIDFEIGL